MTPFLIRPVGRQTFCRAHLCSRTATAGSADHAALFPYLPRGMIRRRPLPNRTQPFSVAEAQVAGKRALRKWVLETIVRLPGSAVWTDFQHFRYSKVLQLQASFPTPGPKPTLTLLVRSGRKLAGRVRVTRHPARSVDRESRQRPERCVPGPNMPRLAQPGPPSA